MAAGRSAIVLAGGRSSRMGADKAALRLGGLTMLERMVAELTRGFDEVVIVAGARAVTPACALAAGSVRMLRDPLPFEGPVKALRLGLAAIRAEVAFACACDLPFVNVRLALELCKMAAGHDAAIAKVAGRLQVLHAAYRKSCLPAMDAMIEREERRLQDLVPVLDARIVGEDETRPYDPELLSFFNLNTPEDYAQARKLAGKLAP
jgi:molybdopterin-guanine dinucleotide biosynthesis protein A